MLGGGTGSWVSPFSNWTPRMPSQAVAMVALQIVMPSAMLFEDPEAMQDRIHRIRDGRAFPLHLAWM